jgi:hypothetical protein
MSVAEDALLSPARSLRPHPVSRRFGRRLVPVFQLCGTVGFVAACVIALGLAAARGLSLEAEVTIIGVAVTTFFGLAYVTAQVCGRERLVYLHHELAVLALAAATAAALGAPVAAHLDVTALGLGAFLACGRIGCLRVGCCHGRPAARGVVYSRRHAEAGFPAYLVGRPLVPVQLIESVGAMTLVGVGGALVLSGARPGVAFAVYVGGYAAMRVPLEELRGDPDRAIRWNLTEPQWLSTATATLTAGLEVAGALPLEAVAPCVAAVLGGHAAIRVAGPPRRPPGLLDGRHVREIAAVLAAGQSAPVPATALGVRLTQGRVNGGAHYALSRRPVPLGGEDAQALAAVILALRHPHSPGRVHPGVGDVYHLLVES